MAAVVPTGQLAISVGLGDGSPGTAILLVNPKVRQSHEVMRTTSQVGALAASADGRYLAVVTASNAPDPRNRGSIRIVDLRAPSVPRTLAAGIGFDPSVEFAERGHLLASASPVDRHIRLWDLDKNQECVFNELADNTRFVSDLGYLLCNRGQLIDLNSRSRNGCPALSARELPSWDAMAVDHDPGIAFAGRSFVGKSMGSGYRPSKIVAFNLRDGSVLWESTLPYPESEERIDRLEFIGRNVLMVSERRTIVLHDARSMRTRAVLGGGHNNPSIYNAVYMPGDDAIYASNGSKVLKWDLGQLNL